MGKTFCLVFVGLMHTSAITSSVITFISFGFFFVKKFRLNLNLGVSESLEVGLDIEELWKNFLLLSCLPLLIFKGWLLAEAMQI